jgi:hypothetical protein
VRAELDFELTRAGFASIEEVFCTALETVVNIEN